MPDSFSKIISDVLGCKKCGLHKTRKNPVVGSGSEHAGIMFIGEAPGANEDLKGIPFCGAAGKILDELLNYAGLRREDTYIANILKCRPPQNRNPKEEEIKACTSYLDRQIALIRPKAICCLGNFSAAYIMKKFGLQDKIKGISRIHGKVFAAQGIFTAPDIITFYHPAVATYNINMKTTLKKDFLVLRKYFQPLSKLSAKGGKSMDLTFAFAVNQQGILLKGEHFGNSPYYEIYKLGEDKADFLNRRKNGKAEEEEKDDTHGDARKANSIASILKDVDVLAGREFGPNIKRMIKKFACVIVRVATVEEALTLIRDNWEKVKQEYKKGPERKPLVLAAVRQYLPEEKNGFQYS